MSIGTCINNAIHFSIDCIRNLEENLPLRTYLCSKEKRIEILALAIICIFLDVAAHSRRRFENDQKFEDYRKLIKNVINFSMDCKINLKKNLPLKFYLSTQDKRIGILALAIIVICLDVADSFHRRFGDCQKIEVYKEFDDYQKFEVYRGFEDYQKLRRRVPQMRPEKYIPVQYP